jgi:hypothetical protein
MAVYLEGNVTPSNPDGTLDNWSMLVDATTLQAPPTTTRQGTAFPYPPITTTSADVAYAQVLDRAGATVPARDAVDTRIVGGVRSNTGLIIDRTADVGGWPALDPGAPLVDTDHDGMPDAWELAHALDPNDIADVDRDPDGAGYTNLEHYLSELAGDVMPARN